MAADRDREFLAELQAMSLNDKFQRTLGLVGEWHNHFNNQVYVSLSGGKDSTVLADIDAKWCKAIGLPLNLVFSNTGLEYPEIQRHVRELKPFFEDRYGIEVNLTIVRPKMQFSEVISKYGYPLIGKEVAEAIYYARRIRSAERERAPRPNDTASQTGTARNPNLIETSTARNRRTILQGKWGEAGVAHSDSNHPYTREELRKMFPQGKGRRMLQPDPRDPMVYNNIAQVEYERGGAIRKGERGVFSNSEEQFGAKSQFNKERYLPLARDVPVMISHYCCNVMKKSPVMTYQRQTGMKPFLGTMAEESRLRTQAWIRHGCNAFESKKNTSQPLSFWREQDILAYTLAENLPLASVYGDIVAVDELGNEYEPQNLIAGCGKLKCTGCQRTGCIFCGFGAHLEKPGEGRFERLAYTHPKQYDYCINGGHWVDNPHYDPSAPEYDGEWKNWNPKKIWTPDEKGLGMGKVFEMVNEIYGKEFIRY